MKILYGLPEPLHVTLLAKKKTQCVLTSFSLVSRRTLDNYALKIHTRYFKKGSFSTMNVL